MSSVTSAGERVDFAGIQALASRGAGYAVALKCLQVQADAEARDPSLRTTKRVVLHEDAWSWYQGALGEIEVGALLRVLGPEWFVRHSVPIGAATKDVDHLVIGPGGVFAINTKHHQGLSVWVADAVLRVNNANTPHLKIARNDALDVARRLTVKVGFPVTVTPVIAVLNARSITDRRAAGSRAIPVVNAKNLAEWLVGQPHTLSQARLDLIKLAAEEPETWHVDPRAADTFRIMQRFDRLVSQVGTAHLSATPATRTRATRGQRPAGRSRMATPARTSGLQSRGRRSVSVALRDLAKLWFGVTLITAAILIFRGFADQPCTSPIGCLVPALYLGIKPVLTLLGVVALAGGAIGTIVCLRRSVMWRPPGEA